MQVQRRFTAHPIHVIQPMLFLLIYTWQCCIKTYILYVLEDILSLMKTLCFQIKNSIASKIRIGKL